LIKDEHVIRVLEQGHETGDYEPFMEVAWELATRWLKTKRIPSVTTLEDMRQEFMLKVWQHRESLRPNTARRYLLRMLHNLLTNAIRAQARAPLLPFPQSDDDIDDAPERWHDPRTASERADANLWADMAHLLDALEYQFVRMMFDGYSEQEIAQELELTARQIQRLRATIRAKLDGYFNRGGTEDED